MGIMDPQVWGNLQHHVGLEKVYAKLILKEFSSYGQFVRSGIVWQGIVVFLHANFKEYCPILDNNNMKLSFSDGLIVGTSKVFMIINRMSFTQFELWKETTIPMNTQVCGQPALLENCPMPMESMQIYHNGRFANVLEGRVTTTQDSYACRQCKFGHSKGPSWVRQKQ